MAKSFAKEFLGDLPPWAKAVLTIGALGGAFLIARSISKKIKDPTKKGDAAGGKNPFDYKLFLGSAPKGHLLLTQSSADGYAKKIYDAMGCNGDNEETIFGVFRALKTQSQVAFLARAFYLKYGLDLRNTLKNGICTYFPINPGDLPGLNTDELGQVDKIVFAKPLYK